MTTVGAVTVASSDLLLRLDRLDRLARGLDSDLARVETAAAVPGGAPVDELRPPLRAAAIDARSLAAGLRQAAAGYAEAERDAEGLQRTLAALLAAQLGLAVRPAVITALVALALRGASPLLATASPLLAGWRPPPGWRPPADWREPPDDGEGALRRWFLDHPELITSPGFTRLVELAASSSDDFLGTAVGMPPVWAITRDGGSETGVEAGAAGVITIGALLGMFRETPVRVDQVSERPLSAPPTGVGGRLERVPEINQVRIETYTAPGMPPRHLVYVGPTETFSPFARDEPWDLTSNVHGVAGLEAGSFRATELAMQQAGIAPGDEVAVVGFSQGGLVASMVAASGDWNVVGLETHGAPAGNLELPSGMAGMAVRNTDDFIPALAGPQTDAHLLQVERRAFAEGQPVPTDLAAPAHQRTAYVATAAAIDADPAPQLREQVAAMDAFAGDYLAIDGAAMTVSTFHGERLDEADAPGSQPGSRAISRGARG